MCVRENSPVFKQPDESRCVVFPETVQVVVAKLVDHNGQYQLWLLGRHSGWRDMDSRD
jgi:hypothetical protein